MTDAPQENRPPRGALAVIAVGLFACVAAALLSTDKAFVAELEWVEKAPMPDSKSVAIPGGGEMRLTDAGIRATEVNAGGYTLYRVAGLLTIDAGSAVGSGLARCAVRVPELVIVAQTPNSRASYPHSSEELIDQPVPENSLVEFSSHSTDLALVELSDALGSSFTDEKGIVVEWAPFRIGQQAWQWGLPSGRPGKPLRLPFASIWRTTTTPAAKVACTVETSAGQATVRTAGTLSSN